MNDCALCVVWKRGDVSGEVEGLHSRVGTSGVGVGGTMEILTHCLVCRRGGVVCTPVRVVRALCSGDSVVSVEGIEWSRPTEGCFATRRRPPGLVYETAMRRGMGGGQHADLAE